MQTTGLYDVPHLGGGRKEKKMVFDKTVHHYELDSETRKPKIVKITPYHMYDIKGFPKIFRREGTFFYEGGEKVSRKELPPALQKRFPAKKKIPEIKFDTPKEQEVPPMGSIENPDAEDFEG